MSAGSHDYYRSSRSTHHNDRSLPSIRDVVGDELVGRVRPNPYTFGDVRGALPSSHRPHTSRTSDNRGPTLPPIRHSSQASSLGTSGYASETQGRYPTTAVQSRQSRRYSTSSGHHGNAQHDSSHIYGVLRPSATAAGDLIHATPPAERPHGILRQSSTSRALDQDPDRRYRCDYCGKGFDRPSSLDVHLRTHTGSQPFTCEWPGCNRTFSVRSNMLRHWRSHESRNGSSQHRGSFDDKDDIEDARDNPSSPYTSSLSQPSSSHYYSSSRRK